MRTKLYFVAALAATMLASCADDKFVGDNSPNVVQNESTETAINFGGGFKAITRANHVGADAASMLNKEFVVGGFKGGSTAATGLVFDNYVVKWTENTAGTTESNTSDWEYVGITGSDLSPVTSVTTQTIKYWDYSQTLYDFVAYSTGTATAVSGSPGSNEIKVTAISTSDHSFSLNGTETNLIKCFVADRVTVEKVDFGKEVTLTFRNLAAKVRVALYETIPGYSVKDVYFYDNNTDAISKDISSKTSATLIGTFNTGGTYTVTYPGKTKGQSDYNKAHVNLTDATNEEFRNTFGNLNYTNGEGALSVGTDYLQRSSKTPSFAGTGTYYQTVLPNETGAVMELRINYTLVANDGSNETITIHGAKAYVPQQFTKWLPNYAYTYIFKISDNTNGWASTSESDPAGLYPITFDAIVIDSEDNTQSTITTVAKPSITTYQKGHAYTDGPEYYTSTNDIYVQVMMDGSLMGNLNSKGQLYTLSADKSEAEVLDALNIQSASDENTITGRNGLVLTKASSNTGITSIPGEDGNPIVISAGQAASFAANANTYAYVYDTDQYAGTYYSTEPAGWPTGYFTDPECKTNATDPFAAGTFYQSAPSYIYAAEHFAKNASKPTPWADNTYYEDPNGETAYNSWSSDTFPTEGKTLYRKYTVNHKVYGVKVIKVVTAT
jgi:hypothetical protein